MDLFCSTLEMVVQLGDDLPKTDTSMVFPLRRAQFDAVQSPLSSIDM